MMDSADDLTRRTVLKSGAGGALSGMLFNQTPSIADSEHQLSNPYTALGIEPVINAAGTITTLGGSLMPPEVVAAWTAASRSFVRLNDLQDRVGERIAKLLGVEAALVTTGAAGGIMVGTAAAVTYRDPSLVGQLPLPPKRGIQVIRQRAHRTCYDHLVSVCGVRLVDVETRLELEQSINDRTAMLLSYNFQEDDGMIKRSEWVQVARQHGIPTLIDAAADAPPVDALWKYNQMGYDMVVFSGGKAIRGPQGAGLLLGRKDLIEAAKLNTSPRCGNIGRGLKVSKEDMVAMWTAVERFVHLDHEAEWRSWENRIGVIADALQEIPSLQTKQIVPPIANQVPHLLIRWDEKQVRITPQQIQHQLAEGRPSIATARVHGTGNEGLLISVFMLQRDEDRIVGSRLQKLLKQASLK